MDKLVTMTSADSEVSPEGRTSAQAANARGRRSPEYRAAREEYAEIRALREKNWIAAHIRERRYELDLTQQEVAQQAGTSHSFISKLESGDHIPTIPVLNRILAVLDEQLLIGIERKAARAALSMRRSRHCPDSTLNSISAMFSQLPCLGV